MQSTDTLTEINFIAMQLCELTQMTTAFSEAVRQEDESDGERKLDNYVLYGALLQKIEEISTAVGDIERTMRLGNPA